MVIDRPTDRGDEKDLLGRIEELEKQNAELAARNVTLRAESATLRVRSDSLGAEVERLRGQLEETDASRPGVTFNQLGGQIRRALTAIEEVGDGPTRYVARSAEFELKGAFDSENEELVLRLPGLTQRVDPGLLGTMRIELTGGDTGEVDLSDLVLVPTLLGMTGSGAGNRLAAAGLAIGQTSERESVKPAGTIIGQDPPGGSYVPPATAIDVVVASDQVTVPDLSGRNVERAAVELVQRGLKVGDIKTRKSELAAGTIVAQAPKAGSRVDRQSAVDLTVADVTAVAVPNVTGRTLENATTALTDIGLDAGPVTQEPSEKRRGTVLNQKPGAGTQVPLGSRIALVTAGPKIQRARPVPDVVGSGRVAAVEALDAAGFTATIEAASRRGGIAPRTFDTVLSQVPGGGVPSADSAATLKIIAASVLALGVLAGAASASSQSIFADINAAAPRAVFADLADTAPRSPFDALNDAAPRSPFGALNDAAPRSVFADIDAAAPNAELTEAVGAVSP